MVAVLNKENIFGAHTANKPVTGYRLLDTSEFVEEFGCRALHPGLKVARDSHSWLAIV